MRVDKVEKREKLWSKSLARVLGTRLEEERCFLSLMHSETSGDRRAPNAWCVHDASPGSKAALVSVRSRRTLKVAKVEKTREVTTYEASSEMSRVSRFTAQSRMSMTSSTSLEG